MTYEKAVAYDYEAKDFALYLGRTGEEMELVGFARTFADGEQTLNELITSLLTREYAQPIEAPVA